MFLTLELVGAPFRSIAFHSLWLSKMGVYTVEGRCSTGIRSCAFCVLAIGWVVHNLVGSCFTGFPLSGSPGSGLDELSMP